MGSGAWIVLLAGLAACGGDAAETVENVPPAESLITPDNVVVVDSGTIESGPTISGALQAERRAQIRAELSGAIVAVSAEQGQRVASGALLGRIDDTVVRDNFLSARSTATTAEQAATVARRNVQRSEALLQAGAISESALEDARLQLQTAESQQADAQARLAVAQDQLGKAEIRAPFAGIVSERAINAGDIVQPGAPLFTVVDPASMRLEGSVAATQLEHVRVGAPVSFAVTGYGDRAFEGRVTRVAPTADAATGQINVIAELPNASGQLVGGLYAEGLIAAAATTGLVVPLTAVDVSPDGAEVLRLKNGTVERVQVQTGLRDDRSERIEITAGIERGDTLLLGPARTITPGTPVRVQAFESAR